MRALLVAIATFLFPGLGAGLAGRRRAMLAWVAVTYVGLALSAASVWALPLVLVLRLAEMAYAFRVARAAPRWDWIGALITIGLGIAVAISLRMFVTESFNAPSSSMVPTIAVGDHFIAEKLSGYVRSTARGDVIVFRQPCEPDREFVMRVIALAGDTIEIRCSTVHVGGAPLASQLVSGDRCTYLDRDEGGAWYAKGCSEYTETAGDHTYRVYHDADRPLRDERRDTMSSGDDKDFPRLDVKVAPSCEAMASMGGQPDAVSNQQPGSVVETRAEAGPCDRQLHYVVPAGHVFVLGDNRGNSNDSRFWGSVPVENITARVTGIWMTIGASGTSFRRFGGID